MPSENPNSLPPPVAKPSTPLVRILIGIFGVIAMIGGIAQCMRGFHEMTGGESKEHKQLLTDSDKEIDNGNKYSVEAQSSFQGMLNDVDKNGLGEVRAKDKEIAEKTSALLGKSNEAFNNAAQKLEEANKIGKDEKIKAFITLKIKSYGLYAQGPAANQEIIRLLFDPSIPDIGTLMPKITEVANRRDAAQKEAAKTADEAAALAKTSK